MFLKTRAKYAFNRTQPHPEDWRVRITDNSNDLIAIHHPEVRAVVWQRGLPSNVIEALETLKVDDYIKTQDRYRRGSKYSSFPFKESINDNSVAEDIPVAIHEDTIQLSKAFVHATVDLLIPNIVHPHITCQVSGDSVPSFKNYLEQFNGDAAGRPHIDGSVLFRLVSTYTLNEEYTTEWYPRTFTPEEEDEFVDLVCNSSDPEQVKHDFNVQRLAPGDVLALKGDIQRQTLASQIPGRKWEFENVRQRHELLVHNTPAPQANGLRFTYLFP